MLYALAGVLGAALVYCIIKIYLLKKSARELRIGFAEKLRDDTNTRIDISSADKDMRRLADDLNKQLSTLRNEYLHYHHGNTELKTAITNISHDLRTPLTVIYGYLEMMKNTDDPQKQREYLDIIKERAELMKQLTEELFKNSVLISDEEEMPCEEVYVNKVLEECIAGFYPQLSKKGIAPNIVITDEKILRNANKGALSRVFTNLLSNALKYSDGDLDITLEDSGEMHFKNTAKKLSAVDVEKLFDRFFTVENARHSTGLGLAITRTLVERMGGTVNASYDDSVLNITIILPKTGPQE